MTGQAGPVNAGGAKRKAGSLSEEEQAVVRRLSGGFGWPTIVLAAALLAAQVGLVAGWMIGVVPMAVAFVVNSFLFYAWYTVHHEATHKTISGRKPRWRWVDVACGNVAGFALMLDFDGYARNHLRHHANTNTDADPDLMVKGPLVQMPLKWFVAMTFSVVGALPGGPRIVALLSAKLGVPVPSGESERDKADLARMRHMSQAGLLVLIATIPFGWFWPALLLWWLPNRVAILYLMVLFQWLPHFPFDRTDRFGATRVTRWPGSAWILFCQDRHLIHHLYPSIPWYRYRTAFNELRHLLQAKGAIIEGSDTDPHAPIRLRELDPAGS